MVGLHLYKCRLRQKWPVVIDVIMRPWLEWSRGVSAMLEMRWNRSLGGECAHRWQSFQTFLLDLTVNCGLDRKEKNKQYLRLLGRDRIRQILVGGSPWIKKTELWIFCWCSFQPEGGRQTVPCRTARVWVQMCWVISWRTQTLGCKKRVRVA